MNGCADDREDTGSSACYYGYKAVDVEEIAGCEVRDIQG